MCTGNSRRIPALLGVSASPCMAGEPKYPLRIGPLGELTTWLQKRPAVASL